MLFRQAFNFYIINSVFGDTLDLVVQIKCALLDPFEDRVLAGILTPGETGWAVLP
jgi:hypothetical protein